MDDTTRELAERLRSADELRRFAEASVVVAMCDLAEAYAVDDYDDLLDVLTERRITVGGPGTPRVSEFVGLELAGLLRCPASVAGGRLADALNLKHRHPRLFRAVQQGLVEADRACKAASMCADLDGEVAERVTDRWTPRQEALGWTACFTLLKKLIAEADLELAAEREKAARAWRGVHVWGLDDGVMNLTGKLDVLDARYLDAAVERVADILTDSAPDQPKDVLRAKALGVLANPAYALALLQRAAQPALTDPVPCPERRAEALEVEVAAAPRPSQLPFPERRAEALEVEVEAAPRPSQLPFPEEVAAAERQRPSRRVENATSPASPDQPPLDESAQRHDPHCLGALCGTITTPLSGLRPRLELAVHIHTDAVGHLTGTARVDRAGHITTALLAELLPGLDVTVQPVIDLPELPAEDGYVPSAGLKRALLLAMDREMFPHSTRRAKGLDLDHTVPFRAGPPGQSRIGNLAPLSRRAHRAKTRCAWRVQQPSPGRLVWWSPLGYTYETTLDGTRMRR